MLHRHAGKAPSRSAACRHIGPVAGIAAPCLFLGLVATPLVARADDETDTVEAEVILIVKVTGQGGDAEVEVPLPRPDARQTVLSEEMRLRGFQIEEIEQEGLRLARLRYPSLHGRKRFTWKGRVRLRRKTWHFEPPGPGWKAPEALHRWIIPTPHLQCRSPLVREQLIRGVEPALARGERDLVQLIYRWVARTFERRKAPEGTSSVLKALRTRKVDDRGLDRLFVTFLRAAGIPARTVGGLRVDAAEGKRFRRWTEVWLAGEWVPFSVPEGWYGAIPAGYLKLYHGDRRFIRRRNVARTSFKILVRP